MDKRIHKRIDRNDDEITLEDIQKMINDLQEEYPDREVFFDGDEFAICSRKKDR